MIMDEIHLLCHNDCRFIVINHSSIILVHDALFYEDRRWTPQDSKLSINKYLTGASNGFFVHQSTLDSFCDKEPLVSYKIETIYWSEEHLLSRIYDVPKLLHEYYLQLNKSPLTISYKDYVGRIEYLTFKDRIITIYNRELSYVELKTYEE